jgi:hypothetical protein
MAASRLTGDHLSCSDTSGSQSRHNLCQRGGFYLLAIENSADRFAVKPGLFCCFAQSKRFDLRDEVFICSRASPVVTNASIIDVFDEIVFALFANGDISFPMQCCSPPWIVTSR